MVERGIQMDDRIPMNNPQFEEDFAKVNPTRNPNPEDLLFLGGYQGEMLRELATAGMDTNFDNENNYFPLTSSQGFSQKKKD